MNLNLSCDPIDLLKLLARNGMSGMDRTLAESLILSKELFQNSEKEALESLFVQHACSISPEAMAMNIFASFVDQVNKLRFNSNPERNKVLHNFFISEVEFANTSPKEEKVKRVHTYIDENGLEKTIDKPFIIGIPVTAYCGMLERGVFDVKKRKDMIQKYFTMLNDLLNDFKRNHSSADDTAMIDRINHMKYSKTKTPYMLGKVPWINDQHITNEYFHLAVFGKVPRYTVTNPPTDIVVRAEEVCLSDTYLIRAYLTKEQYDSLNNAVDKHQLKLLGLNLFYDSDTDKTPKVAAIKKTIQKPKKAKK
jgi:hypothetical protein